MAQLAQHSRRLRFMNTNEIRSKYLDFYTSKGHTVQPSDVLVPRWDASVLFTPAGMNQFKDHFLGKVKLDFTKATTCQKCLRTGDIDNVGRTAYHHTFFEMLGNFSFGDYFKKEAIAWAWEFLTDKKWMGVDPDRLTVTVYKDDTEAAEIWQNDIGLASSRITPMGEDDNFWPASAPSQGPDGVCGPCSEIFFRDDRGEDVEIWNLVFTQFNRVGDPPENLRPLPSRNIDTGMGLERMASVMQGVDTNYHIDILQPIVDAAAEVTGRKYEASSEDGRRLRRITDHVRACTFAIHENVYPGPQKESYVIRRLLRRAVLDGHQMGLRDPFLSQLTPTVVEQMKGAYPELTESIERVQGVIDQEEKAFFGVLDKALARIDGIFSEMENSGATIIDGKQAANLYQTYGVPPELFAQMGVERSYTFDTDGYEAAMTEHGGATGPGVLFGAGAVDALKETLKETTFVGYDKIEAKCEVKGIVLRGESGEDESGDDTLCDHFTGNDAATLIVVLDESPFYGESGGQVGDTGEIVGDQFTFQVEDTQKDGGLLLHIGKLTSGEITTGATATAMVDTTRRDGIRRAHSATHILHYALQDTLGDHAQQKGSKVDEDWLRFDFTNLEPVSAEQINTIETMVGERVETDATVDWQTLPLTEAREAGAMMLFGEKYPDPVRMVSIGDYSKELCGGTHLTQTGQIGRFELLSEEGVSAGVRRVIALTGKRAEEHAEKTSAEVASIAKQLDVPIAQAFEAAGGLMKYVRDLKKELSGGQKAEEAVIKSKKTDAPSYAETKNSLRDIARLLNVSLFDSASRIAGLVNERAELKTQIDALASGGELSPETLLEEAATIDGVKVIIRETPGANSNLMRQWIDQVRKKHAPTAIMLAAAQGDKVLLVAGVTRDLVERKVSAGNWVKEVAPVVGGGGGGKPDLAQAGGKDPSKMPEALTKADEVIRILLS